MWENEKKKAIIRNCIFFLLLVIAAAGLLITMKQVNAQIAEEDALLLEEHSSQRQELNEARQENLDAVQQVYEHHQNVVKQYLPGIVCWGDSLTTGTPGNVSYPGTLQNYIDTYLCDIYDLRYSIENPETFPRLDWESYKISVPVVNMGSGQENSATILGRSGVLPFVIQRDFVIPAGTESVNISFLSENGKPVTPLTAGNAGVNPVVIAGVEGTLTSTQSWGNTVYQFTRLTAGAETPVAKGTPIITASKDAYKDYIHIVWMGSYGEYATPETMVQEVKLLLQRQLANTDRYLVVGPCTYMGSWSNATETNMNAIDSAMLQAFGNRYVNLRKYMVEDGMRDAGLTATKDDKEQISKGQVPNSFRSNAGGVDLNGAAYRLLGKLIYERMELLGYFTEVQEALHLDKITQDILKNDPKYFETRLK